MSTMTNEEQVAALQIVGKLVANSVCNYLISRDPGDVVYLCAPVPNASQIVCPIRGEGYDVWQGGKLKKTDLQAVEAAKIVIGEYKANKIDIVMSRMVGSDWRKKTNDPVCATALKEVTDQVMDLSLQKAYSDMQKSKN
jgi:hypothetical protein